MRYKRLGRYELLEELSRDRDGTVYRARDPLLGRLVAIRTVERDPLAQTDNSDFERKVGLAGGLAHPNLVTVYDAGIRRDVSYIATELIGGETLREILDARVALPPAAIERIAAQVADGLDFMHRRAIVHGDVNPSTVVVLDIGFVKLACLGNALFRVGESVPATGVPTSRYASPEHAGGAPVDARSDVFSLGVVLYEMLTGIAPFSGDTSEALVDAITQHHPRAPSALNPGIPSGFDYVVARALSKDPDHRYQSARDMAIHLRRWALEGSTFFAVPRAAAPMQTPLPHPAPGAQAGAVPVDMPANAAVPQGAVHGDGVLRTRRQWLRYAVPVAVVSMSAVWTIWSRSTSTPQPRNVTASSSKAATADRAVLVPVRDEVPPGSASANDESSSTSVEPAGSSSDDESSSTSVEPASGSADDGSSSPSVAQPMPASMQHRPVARLKLAVSPWGEIYVDGRKRGISPPLRQIDLAPGKHRIEIRNTNFPSRRESVVATANGRLRIKHKFKR
jgi:serine/threonine-protein kinase